MVIFYKKWKKVELIQLTKNKMDLNNRKNLKIIHPPPDRYIFYFTLIEVVIKVKSPW